MAQTPSTLLLPLGASAPEFDLPDPTGKRHSLAEAAGAKAIVIMFICNHCPFVKHVRPELVRLARDYISKGVAFFAISSNDVERYSDDSPENMAKEAREAGYTFPYLYDESQEVAKAYMASCTPDFYVFDGHKKLVYRGQLDGSRPPSKEGGNTIPVTGADVREALDAVLEGKRAREEMRPSIGCNIKWKPGNEPSYYDA